MWRSDSQEIRAYVIHAGALLTLLLGGRPAATMSADFEITALSDDAPAGLEAAFDRQVDVFGVRTYATPGVPRAKLLHVANVLAQYLDNDANGAVDNRRVLRRLLAGRAAMIMFVDFAETEAFFESVDAETLEGLEVQDVNAVETHPGGAAEGRFDASLEEVLHLISHVGLSAAYPRVWGERSGHQAHQGYGRRPRRSFRDRPRPNTRPKPGTRMTTLRATTPARQRSISTGA